MPQIKEHAKNIAEAEERRRATIMDIAQNLQNNLFLDKCLSVQHCQWYCARTTLFLSLFY